MAPLPPTSASQTTAERVAKWAQDNAIALTLGAGAVAVGGYWFLIKDSSPKSSGSGSGSNPTQSNEEKKSSSDSASKKPKSKKKKSTPKQEVSTDGPLLDEADISECKIYLVEALDWVLDHVLMERFFLPYFLPRSPFCPQSSFILP